jgi:hypothetical protein
LFIHFQAFEKAFNKHIKHEKIFSWYNLVSFVIIAYKARHTLNNQDLIRGFCYLEKLTETNRCERMAEIKSTLEKVMERAASMGHATQEEIATEERVKDGMRMAANYLRGEEVGFSDALEQTSSSVLIKKGLVQAFLRNITLPRDDDQQRAERATQGLLALGKESGDLLSIFKDMQGILDHYLQHKKEILQQVEDAFRQQMEQAMAQQTGQAGLGMNVDPKLHPKFQEEWMKVKSDLDTQYNQALDQHKDLVAQRFLVTV